MNHDKMLKETENKLKNILTGKTVNDVKIPLDRDNYGEIILKTSEGNVHITFDVRENWIVYKD
ncbi:hypothetical protein IEN91_04970 [Bacillus velezensis]|uniref:hypothetical protein n=1 Tax=Bacillus velezensis TaxID=492670 RepID=UPI0018C4A4D3|nr:hypothetical protein [Bacillus velezensis]QPK89795.1 hypothetical protein IEN91_04970 [Bacillus velezensis]